MSKTFHMCLDVKGALTNWKLPAFKNMFTREDDTTLTPTEAKAHLLDELSKGREKLPMGKCDNFDFKTGCRGHEQ